MAYCNKTTLPSCNRLLEKKWDSRRLHAHHEKLRATKPTIDSNAPKQFLHIRQNLRKAQLEEDRLMTIQHHNHQLLTRMNQIMHTTGRVDHRNLDWKPKRSMNFVKKQQEVDRLARENQTILRRIQCAKPQYNAKTWESDFRHHQSMSRSLALLPPLKVPGKKRSRTLPEYSLNHHKGVELTSITSGQQKGGGDRPETDQSEIHEEIDLEQPATELI